MHVSSTNLRGSTSLQEYIFSKTETLQLIAFIHMPLSITQKKHRKHKYIFENRISWISQICFENFLLINKLRFQICPCMGKPRENLDSRYRTFYFNLKNGHLWVKINIIVAFFEESLKFHCLIINLHNLADSFFNIPTTTLVY